MNHNRATALAILATVSAMAGAISVTELPTSVFEPLVVMLLLFSITAGWIQAIKSRAFEYRSGLHGSLHGHLTPVRSRWTAPMAGTWALPLLSISSGVLLGISLRVLWATYV